MYCKKMLALCASALFLSACGGGGSSGSTTTATTPTASVGVFVDSVVEGLHYETPTYSGTTNSAGEYDYLPGETVTFSIGGILLGSSTAGPVVTPLTLVSGATDATDPEVSNIVRFLLTLDDDGNSDNGITITAATTTAAAGLTVDFTADLATDSGTTTLLAAIGSPTLVDTATAETHLTETLTTTWGSMSWGPSGTIGGGTWKATPP